MTTFLYDGFGAVTNETVVGVAGTNTIERFYDSFGRSLGYALNGVRQSTLAYDPATGRLASMLAAGSDMPFMWNYLPGSDIKSSLAYPNGLTASWQYDANSQLLQVKNAFPTNTISQYDYVYDAAGRRISCAKSGSIQKGLTLFVQKDVLISRYVKAVTDPLKKVGKDTYFFRVAFIAMFTPPKEIQQERILPNKAGEAIMGRSAAALGGADGMYEPSTYEGDLHWMFGEIPQKGLRGGRSVRLNCAESECIHMEIKSFNMVILRI